MKNAIVITSIFHPTKAVVEFSQKKDCQLIVVGDKKTPVDWQCDFVDFISISQQESMNFELARVLPYNHYCRKMLGYLKAIQNGAEWIYDTDDDNIPKVKHNGGALDFPTSEGRFNCIPEEEGFINIYQLYTQQKIWPRGLPLSLINTDFQLEKKIELKHCEIGIWQGLADEDPDVDAIYRLTSDKPCYFDEREPIVLGKGTVSPFNTQNTLIRKDLFTLMYLPTYVTFRFTDILRGLVAQPIMWLYNYQLGFTNATVIQKRNPHNYMEDFDSEIPMYRQCEKVIEKVSIAVSAFKSIETNLYAAYEALLNENIVCEKEMLTLESWLKDMQVINNSCLSNTKSA